jgi:hypothetical protein
VNPVQRRKCRELPIHTSIKTEQANWTGRGTESKSEVERVEHSQGRRCWTNGGRRGRESVMHRRRWTLHSNMLNVAPLFASGGRVLDNVRLLLLTDGDPPRVPASAA